MLIEIDGKVFNPNNITCLEEKIKGIVRVNFVDGTSINIIQSMENFKRNMKIAIKRGGIGVRHQK